MADTITTIGMDITGCDTEPIHVPGSIQPHGVLLSLGASPSLTIEQVSENTEQWLRRSPADLLGKSFADLAEDRSIDALRDGVTIQRLPVALGIYTPPNGALPLTMTAHRRVEGVDGFVVEMERAALGEPIDANGGATPESFFRFVNQTFLQLRGATSRTELYQRTVEEVRRLTDFDRVMLYRFFPDEHGEVVAEARRDDLHPLLGLNYPASDIPRQARALYVKSHIRLIADVGYQPVPLVAREPGPPLDLTYSSLRSVSPIHIQYLKNMGVGASMSISVVHEDRLWGLIACHHETPRCLSYQTRNVCELLGQTVAAQIVAYDAREEIATRDRARTLTEEVARRLEGSGDLAFALTGGADSGDSPLLALLEAGGVAALIPRSDEMETATIAVTGATPPIDAIRPLIDFLAESVPDEIYATDSLAATYPSAADFADVASGLLAIAISRPPKTRSYLLFFRPEVISTVNWAGDPHTKDMTTESTPSAPEPKQVLSPRASFALWRETVRGHSPPWTTTDADAADRLRRVVVSAILRRTQESLAIKNRDLARSNDELDAFAYIASHDLREPLRGIRNYANFLNEDYRAAVGVDGGGMLDTIGFLTTRMEQFLDSLLEYSRIGSIDLLLRPLDMNVIVAEVLDVLKFRMAEREIEVRIPRRLPVAMADAVRAAEVWTNLITNAAKYTRATDKWVEIGYLDRDPASANLPTVYYVRDNGIGIEPRNHESVFLLFRRLHERDHFGGGTGSGLTIARRITERHGGKIWVESELGQGATFFFTFAPEEGGDSPAGTNRKFPAY